MGFDTIGYLRMLVYLPDGDIPRIFNLVSKMLEDKGSQAVKVLPRLSKYFVLGYERPNDKKHIAPRFPPNMWSCHQWVMEDKPSTTNFLEGKHNGTRLQVHEESSKGVPHFNL